ncbi:MAG TPA: carbohydrate kinase family protein [Patescibacteria group bacterium]|nr:carbohydrate kinase family protein [Patescibacteria group bacterium]
MNERPLITGSLAYDNIMDFNGRIADRIMPEKIHVISLSFLVESLRRQLGGTAGNVAYSAHLLNLEPTICSVLGNDADPYLLFLKQKGISAKHIRVVLDELTSNYFVVTDIEDNQIGAFSIGAGKYSSELDISACGPTSFAALTPTQPEAMTRYVRDCKKLNIPFLFDPAFQIGSMPEDELHEGVQSAQIFIGNDYEVALAEKRLGFTHRELLGAVPIVITTLGSKGSRIETHEECIEVPIAKPTAVVDPTGAGDAYRGGFLGGYLRGFDLRRCGNMGAVAAVYAVEHRGTMEHVYTIDEFRERYKTNFGEALPL